jgi:hypothetical protein
MRHDWLTTDTVLAVLAYLQKVRPRRPRPEVFLTLKAPHRPLSAGALYHCAPDKFLLIPPSCSFSLPSIDVPIYYGHD